MPVFKETRALLLPALLAVAGAGFADTSEDCITDYETLKAQFESASLNGTYECIRFANSLNLFANGSVPDGCEGEDNGEGIDEWELVAKSVVGNPGSCSMKILGSPGQGFGGVDCKAPLREHSLAPNEAAQWQNYLYDECRALGTIRGSGTEDDAGS